MSFAIETASGRYVVRRWSRLSRAAMAALAVLVIAMALVPSTLSTYASEQLTELFLLAILAAMWNALAGYGGLISIGQQAFLGIGAYATIFITQRGVPPYLAMVIAAVVAGYFLHVALIARSLRGGPLVPLLTTFGVAIVVQNSLLQIFSPDVRSLGATAGSITTSSWRITDALAISWFGVLVLAVAVLVLGSLELFLKRTGLGREMRATAQDAGAAELVGVDARAVYARATAIAVATAALAGAFLAMRSTFEPASGPTQLIFAFEAVVIGGFGSLWGTLLGGIVLGVAQTIGAHIDPQYSILAGHLVFLIVLASPRGGTLAGGARR